MQMRPYAVEYPYARGGGAARMTQRFDVIIVESLSRLSRDTFRTPEMVGASGPGG